MSRARAFPTSTAQCAQATPVCLATASSLVLWRHCGGYGTRHDGERYRVRLCESCFFQTLAYLREQRRIHTLIDDEQPADDQVFGRVARDDFFGES